MKWVPLPQPATMTTMTKRTRRVMAPFPFSISQKSFYLGGGPGGPPFLGGGGGAFLPPLLGPPGGGPGAFFFPLGPPGGGPGGPRLGPPGGGPGGCRRFSFVLSVSSSCHHVRNSRKSRVPPWSVSNFAMTSSTSPSVNGSPSALASAASSRTSIVPLLSWSKAWKCLQIAAFCLPCSRGCPLGVVPVMFHTALL